MTDTLVHVRELNRLRQSRFYEMHREEHNEKRRALYKIGRENMKTDFNIIPQQQTYVSDIIDLSKTKTLSFDDVMNHLGEVIEKQSTLNKYKQDFKRLIAITGCSNIIKCLKDPAKLIEDIEDAKKTDDESYSVNTKKSIYQTILFIISHFKLSVSEKNVNILKNKFTEYKVLSSDYTKQVAEERDTMSFKEYIKAVEDNFGPDSKLYVLTLLYDEITLRDDFVLKIIGNNNEAVDDKINYIIVPKKGNLKLIINSYKTDKKYGAIDYVISPSLSQIIRNYIKTNNIEGYLFGDKKLTGFVSTSNKKIGFSGGINEFRHMKITDELNGMKKITATQRIELAEKMKHSPVTQLSYLRSKKMI